MPSLAYPRPPLPGFDSPKTYAAWPVWHDSARAEVKFHPLPKKQAVRIWHDARRFERQTRQAGRQDGALGRNGLAVLHALIFDFLNYASGRLDPGEAAIARMANISKRSVARGKAALQRCGVPMPLPSLLRAAQFALLRAAQFALQNTFSIIPAGIGRTSLDSDLPLKVPVMPKVCTNRVARWAIGASYGIDRVSCNVNPCFAIIRSTVFGEKYQRCSSSSMFQRLPMALATKLSLLGTVTKRWPPVFSTVRIRSKSSSIRGRCSSTSNATTKSNEAGGKMGEPAVVAQFPVTISY
jgi:hypothetical protein